VRSARTDDYDVAFENARRVKAIQEVVPPDLFAIQNGMACGRSRSRNVPRMGLSAAARLLSHPTEPASYVCVSDTGLYEASGGGGYDTHSDNAVDTAVNFDNMLQALLAIIDEPGQSTPGKLSLDDTLIILNTEFGRTPFAQGQTGRNHHPYGYVTAFIGGPVQPGISGAIGPDGNAGTLGGTPQFASPAQNRVAALLALGIWPFSPEGFATSDVPAAKTELEAARLSLETCLGRTL
jgi:hypothetical protein